MSNAIDESLLASLNDLPGRVTNRLLLGVLIETRTHLRRDLEDLGDKVTDLERRLERVESQAKIDEANPSLIWLLRNKPAAVIQSGGRLIVLILLLAGVTNLGHLAEVIKTLASLFGG